MCGRNSPLQESDFFPGLREHPDDLPRHEVYADWLEENGDDRSVVLRSWVELKQMANDFALLHDEIGPQRCHYEQFETTLLQYRNTFQEIACAQWTEEVGTLRPWVNAHLAIQIGRWYVWSGRRYRQEILMETSLKEKPMAWMLSSITKQARSPNPKRIRKPPHSFWVDKLYAFVVGVGSSGPTAALLHLQMHREDMVRK